ncbi:hypothetical protein GYMLUDRAFT_37446 [Collybiopsis luxurians FD-317 M1]|nr:hypothetical protein GYMLUDRAFT_37446 [Collybiopsis luxurians FD-317 M1]
MAQVHLMGPPLSPRARRSGRRAPSLSNSHSPESDVARIVSSSSNGRNKRLKQEDVDDLGEDRKNSSAQSASSSGSNKSKRKPKEKEKPTEPSDPPQSLLPPAAADMTAPEPQTAEEDEEQGITRCICGSTEDDPDAGEFMVQCETCKVWQHGLCMGFESEDLLHDGDYYCEQCRPDMHVELLKRIARRDGRPRHSSATSHHTAGASSRLSRSRSPHQATNAKQPSKRRNTMNSRDAEFDENLKQILETTAIEAGADPSSLQLNGQPTSTFGYDEIEHTTNRNKKRKRVETTEPPATKKRTRSASTASDHPAAANGNEEIPIILPPPPPPVSKSGGRNKRGGRKSAAINDLPVENGDGPIQPALPKRSGNSHRKGGKGGARAPQSNAGTGQAPGSDSKRAQGNNSAAAQNAADARAYRNSHAYVVSQQPLYTSWHLPDYLSHLEEILPTEVPKPLEVVAGAIGRESVERTTERGVKVKWPSKRTSVADMNKRVRALVEWVGREQASASDRARRREALEKAHATIAVAVPSAESPPEGEASAQPRPADFMTPNTPTSMNDMEELMKELILFQEKFGPGARRERRAVVS